MRCTTPKYSLLYARWLEQPGKLLDLAGYTPGQRVLDLCGGTGAVSLEALRRGADPSTITLMDLNPRCPDTRIEQLSGDANVLGKTFGPRQPECLGLYDLIVIRQAAAYLLWDRFSIQWLRGLLKRGGKLVFNTFVKPKWALKVYKYEGRWFLEASMYIRRTIWHLQASPRLGVDVSRFRWLDLNDLERRLNLVLQVNRITSGKSVYYMCTRES